VSRFGFSRSKPAENAVPTKAKSKLLSPTPKPVVCNKPTVINNKSPQSKETAVQPSSIVSGTLIGNGSNSQTSRFGFTKCKGSRSNLNNNRDKLATSSSLPTNQSAKNDGEDVPVAASHTHLPKSPNFDNKLSPKFRKRGSPKPGKHEIKSVSPKVAKREAHRGGLVPRPYRPLGESTSQPLLSFSDGGTVGVVRPISIGDPIDAYIHCPTNPFVPTTATDSVPADATTTSVPNQTTSVGAGGGGLPNVNRLTGSRTFTALPRRPEMAIDEATVGASTVTSSSVESQLSEQRIKSGNLKRDLSGLRANFFSKSHSSSRLPNPSISMDRQFPPASSTASQRNALENSKEARTTTALLSDVAAVTSTSDSSGSRLKSMYNVSGSKLAGLSHQSLSAATESGGGGSRLNSANLHARFNQQINRSEAHSSLQQIGLSSVPTSTTTNNNTDSRRVPQSSSEVDSRRTTQVRSFAFKANATSTGGGESSRSSENVNTDTLEQISGLSKFNKLSVNGAPRSWTARRAVDQQQPPSQLQLQEQQQDGSSRVEEGQERRDPSPPPAPPTNKRKWTKSLSPLQAPQSKIKAMDTVDSGPAGSGYTASATFGSVAPTVAATATRPSALECLNKLKSSTRSIIDQHRTGIRTNPKVSLRRPALPVIPQEESFHEDQISTQQRTRTTTHTQSQTRPAIPAAAATAATMCVDDIDVDNELVILELDGDAVTMKSAPPIVTEQQKEPLSLSVVTFSSTTAESLSSSTTNTTHTTTATTLPPTSALMGKSRAESFGSEPENNEVSPNETESDSGIFTSSHSKYSLESLQEDRGDNKASRERERHEDTRGDINIKDRRNREGADSLLAIRQTSATALEHQNSKAILSQKNNLTEADLESLHSNELQEQSDRLLARSTNTFSDIEEMCSSRETSPLELLDELLRRQQEKSDERKSISPGHVRENCQRFEQTSATSAQTAQEATYVSGNNNNSSFPQTKSGKSILNKASMDKPAKHEIVSPSSSEGENSSLTSVSKPSVRQNPSSNQEMCGSVTNSISMSSSFTESQSACDPVLTEKSSSGTATKTTPSPSSFSDHDKDFLIDDDYKDQPQLTFYDQEDSIEESLFSTLDSLLAGKENEQVIKEENVPKEESKAIETMMKTRSVHDSPLRSAVNLRKFSLTNHLKENLDKVNDDSERSRLRSRADTLSSLASDDCILDYECKLTDDEDEVKMIELERSMSPRIREASKQFEDRKPEEKTEKGVLEGSQGGVAPNRGDTDPYLDYRPSLSRSSSITSDEGVIIDRSTHNTITQDTLEIKFLLLKLRRILQETENNSSDGSVLSNKLLDPSLPQTNDTDLDYSLKEENVDLRRQVVLLQQQVDEKDRRLRQLELMQKSSSAPTKPNTNLKNAAIQTDRQRPMSCGSLSQDGLIRFDEH